MIIKTLHKTAWLTAGSIFLALTVVGLILPIIPQMPFFLAAIFCFMRCSRRFNAWMNRQHWFIRIKKHFPHRQK